MCGINGIISKNQNQLSEVKQKMARMNELIFHRGPDEDGFFAEDVNSATLGMCMRRLSIIDLTTGKQPIFSDDNSIVIVFNGEIYNYRHLKSGLEQKGIRFNTTSDTEVILRLYEEYGTESFKMLDGMFAFSIFDKRINKLFIARDFFGEKPLYYYSDENQFIWASELKSIINVLDKKPEISKKGLNLFFRLTYIPAPFTIYENVLKLEANHYMEFDMNSGSHKIIAIPVESEKEKSKLKLPQAASVLKEKVMESVESRSVSDVPLGTFLSGGVDSSIVSWCLSQISDSKIDTFSIGFEKSVFDETDKSRVVSKLINSTHHEFVINENDLKEHVHDIIVNFDEPFADSSSLPSFLVAKKTSDYIKVALTGDGGDEVFGGYNKYYIGKLNKIYTGIVPSALHSAVLKGSRVLLKTKDDNRGKRFRLQRLLSSVNYNGGFYWDIISLGFTEDSYSNYFRDEYCFSHSEVFDSYKEKTGISNPGSLSEYREIDRHLSLEGDMLVKVDRTSMLNSLECRAPFLNKELWKYASSLPENYLMKGWDKKFILKEAFRSEFPEGFLDKSKSGFGVPVGDWLRSSLREELEIYAKRDSLDAQGIFNVDEISKIVDEHLSNKKDHTFKIWTFYCFQKWYYSIYTMN
ncbi:asparagine synthase (glutamine-hydrolyzing) [Leptobacterium flavescens]|uniref:asparagine synthase (glutamine-hydrolyzing) n=1 Tax=Leptobacterium flavescens TaxID=472055 RepID=A0A6P0UT06_9FLAO|nr:asparagine synthase (glutamine-hydrolyzing) [Leptobacterium flavescens]NER13983.1 asparagine synthase (glutamine-hydrolyzing) [Leptobacterium flavescens]